MLTTIKRGPLFVLSFMTILSTKCAMGWIMTTLTSMHNNETPSLLHNGVPIYTVVFQRSLIMHHMRYDYSAKHGTRILHQGTRDVAAWHQGTSDVAAYATT